MNFSSTFRLLTLIALFSSSTGVFSMSEEQFKSHRFHSESPLQKFIVYDVNQNLKKPLKSFLTFCFTRDKLKAKEKNRNEKDKLPEKIIDNYFDSKLKYYESFFSDTDKIIYKIDTPYIYMKKEFPNLFSSKFYDGSFERDFSQEEAQSIIYSVCKDPNNSRLAICIYGTEHNLNSPPTKDVDKQLLANKSNEILRDFIDDLVLEYTIGSPHDDMVSSIINYDLKQNTEPTNKLADMLMRDDFIFLLKSENFIDKNGNLNFVKNINGQKTTVNIDDFMNQKK